VKSGFNKLRGYIYIFGRINGKAPLHNLGMGFFNKMCALIESVDENEHLNSVAIWNVSRL
jgi:hypothetical protein